MLEIFRLDNLITFILKHIENWVSMYMIPEPERVISETSAMISRVEERGNCNSCLEKKGKKEELGNRTPANLSLILRKVLK